MTERRQHPRVRPRRTASCLGEVLDLSESGMKVFRKGAQSLAIGDRFDAEVEHPGMTVRLTARVIRIEKLGLRRHAIGLTFVDPTPQQRDQIAALIGRARDGCIGPQLWLAA